MNYILGFLALFFFLNCSTNKTTSPYDTIFYESGACYGFCPIYNMTIQADRSAIFEAKHFNFSKNTPSEKEEGTFKGKINEAQYVKLMKLLNSVKPEDLKNEYGNQNVSDLPTSYLTVEYKDGSIKKIRDYGKHGTPELQKLYQFFDGLKISITWTKIE